MTCADNCALPRTPGSSSCCCHASIVLMKFLSPKSIESSLYISILQFTQLVFVQISCSGGRGVVFQKWKFYRTVSCELKTYFWVTLHRRAPAPNVKTLWILEDAFSLITHHISPLSTPWSNTPVVLIFSLSQTLPFSLKLCPFPPIFLSTYTQVLNFFLENLFFKIHFKHCFFG